MFICMANEEKAEVIRSGDRVSIISFVQLPQQRETKNSRNFTKIGSLQKSINNRPTFQAKDRQQQYR